MATRGRCFSLEADKQVITDASTVYPRAQGTHLTCTVNSRTTTFIFSKQHCKNDFYFETLLWKRPRHIRTRAVIKFPERKFPDCCYELGLYKKWLKHAWLAWNLSVHPSPSAYQGHAWTGGYCSSHSAREVGYTQDMFPLCQHSNKDNRLHSNSHLWAILNHQLW